MWRHDLPSITRWYTFSPHLARQSLGLLTHSILARVILKVFAAGAAVDDDGDVPEDYHKVASKKKKQAVAFMGDERAAKLLLGAALIATWPADHLSLRLQHLDGTTGGAMIELTRDPGGCAQRCIHTYEEILSARSDQIPALLWHLRNDDGGFLNTLRSKVVEMAAAVHSRFVLKFCEWPWRLLSGTLMLDEQKRALYNEFLHKVPPCCLDDWWGKPLQGAVSTVSEMLEPQFQAMLTTLARQLKATNMHLEGELSEMKAAVPIGKQCPNAEKLASLAMLGLLLKDHLAKGLDDARGPERRAALLARGVPLEMRGAQQFRRRETAWRNKCLWQWRRSHLDCTTHEEASELLRLSHHWAGLSLEERVAELNACGLDDYMADQQQPPVSVDDADGAPSDLDHCIDDDEGSDDELFNVGSASWPVRPEVLAAFLEQDAVGGGNDGVAAKAARLRKANMGSLVVQDRQDIPADRTFVCRTSCSELHPGLCASRDNAIYHQALAFAKNLESFLSREVLHTFIKVEDNSAVDRLQFYYFCRKRARRMHAHCTHILVRCVELPDLKIFLGQQHLHEWWFVTVWGIARDVLQRGWEHIDVAIMDWRNEAGDNSCVELLNEVQRATLWPGNYRRARAPRAEGPPIPDDLRRQRRRHTGGVKWVSPLTVARPDWIAVGAGVAAGHPHVPHVVAVPGLAMDGDDGSQVLWSRMPNYFPSLSYFVYCCTFLYKPFWFRSCSCLVVFF